MSDISLADDLLWGAEAIAAEIGRERPDTYYLLAKGLIPATRCGNSWISSRSRLREFFAKKVAAEPLEA